MVPNMVLPCLRHHDNCLQILDNVMIVFCVSFCLSLLDIFWQQLDLQQLWKDILDSESHKENQNH